MGDMCTMQKQKERWFLIHIQRMSYILWSLVNQAKQTKQVFVDCTLGLY